MKKKILGPSLGHFFKFGSLVFLEIRYNDSLQQCLTTKRAKIHEKKFFSPFLGEISQNSDTTHKSFKTHMG